MILLGMFGISEVLLTIERSIRAERVFQNKIKGILPNKQDWKDSSGSIVRGTILGFLIGVIPGGSGTLASFFSYAMEKRIAGTSGTFGMGDIRGVAGPETANNASAQGNFIPLLTMGIPCNAVNAILMGALLIHGVIPGPRLLIDHPRVFWGVVGSMYTGNVMLLLLNLPLIGIWVKFLKIPYAILFPFIFLFCLIGAYTVGYNIQNTYIMIFFGLMGYLMKKFEYEAAPLVLAFVLAPMFENAFRQSMIISDSNPIIFLSSPISAIFITSSLLLCISPFLLRRMGKKRPGLLVKEG